MATFERQCEQCGESFSSPRRQARFCGPTCRSRAHRGKPPALTVVPPVDQPKPEKQAKAANATAAPATKLAKETPTYDTLEDQVEATLKAQNALDTIAGRAAIRVAQQIDRGGDAGSAVVALSKELSRLVAEAKVEAAPRNKDQADDILERVNQKILGLVQ